MKTKILLITIFLLVSSISSSAQKPVKIEIKPKKVTYKRDSKTFSEHKRKFYVTYPKVFGNGPNKKIEKAISYWKHFDITLEEEKNDNWLHELSYEVIYNDNQLLNIELTREGSGAYYSKESKTILVDLRFGRVIKMSDAFFNRTSLYKTLEKAQQNEIKQAIFDMKKEDGDIGVNSLKAELESAKPFNSVFEIRQFSISNKGVTFHYDYGFRHAAITLQPEGRYFFTWNEIKPHISEYGIFENFLSKKK